MVVFFLISSVDVYLVDGNLGMVGDIAIGVIVRSGREHDIAIAWGRMFT